MAQKHRVFPPEGDSTARRTGGEGGGVGGKKYRHLCSDGGGTQEQSKLVKIQKERHLGQRGGWAVTTTRQVGTKKVKVREKSV